MPTRKLPKSQRMADTRRLLVYLLLCVILLAIGGGIWYGILGFVKRQWDGKTRFTLVYLTPSVAVYSFDPANNDGVRLVLPEDLEIQTIGGRGNWRSGVIAQAGDPKWAAASIADHLGITFTGIDHKLGWWDRMQWRMAGKSVKWRDINLGDTQFVSKMQQPDGVTLLQLDSSWDARARELFADQITAKESLGVAIVNTVAWPGLGTSVGRVVESMGFKVRSITTSTDGVQQCVVKSQSSLRSTPSVQKLLRVFDCEWQESSEDDLQLLVGGDYVSWKWGITN